MQSLFSRNNRAAIAWRADEAGQITEISPNFEELTGIPADQILRKTLAEALAGLSDEAGRMAAELERRARADSAAGSTITINDRLWLCAESAAGPSLLGFALPVRMFG
jgi:PAS domain-containing protein